MISVNPNISDDKSKQLRIMVGVNTLTSVDSLAYSNHCQFWFRLGRNHPNINFAFSSPHRASIDRMRNTTAKLAVDHNFDYLMFIDDDVLVPVNALARLLACNADIAAGHTIIRGYPFDNMFFKWDNVEKTALRKYNDPIVDEEGLIPCDAVGFSCVLIRVDLLKKIAPPYFVTGPNNTEDVYFCVKAQQHVKDLRIVVDPEVKTAHILGSELIEPENRVAYRKYYEEMHPDEIKREPLKARGDGYLKMIENPTTENIKDHNAKGA